jgi:iron-sulfur cluster repair protein YtfE (RIC family)
MTRADHDTMAEQTFEMHEHRELMPWLDRIHEVGCKVGHVPVKDLAVSLHRIIVWLESDLEGHASWEESWLYPEIDERAGTPWATRTMRFEHHQICAAVRRLAVEQAALGHELTVEQAGHLASHVFGVEALIRNHLEAEERVLLPVLDDPVVAAIAPAIQAVGQPG